MKIRNIEINKSINVTQSLYQSILSTLIDNGINIKYSCLNGHCHLCKVVLISGEVSWIKSKPKILNNKEILGCSCVPITDIKIKIN